MGYLELVFDINIASSGLERRHVLSACCLASALTWATIVSEVRFKTHCFVRCRFVVVWDSAARPSMQRWPSHQAEDIGARFVVPSGFVVEIMMTALPQ